MHTNVAVNFKPYFTNWNLQILTDITEQQRLMTSNFWPQFNELSFRKVTTCRMINVCLQRVHSMS